MEQMSMKMPAAVARNFCGTATKPLQDPLRLILTYFQVDVRVQSFQRVRHAVGLDASQLGHKNTAALDFSWVALIVLTKKNSNTQTHRGDEHQISMTDWRRNSYRKKTLSRDSVISARGAPDLLALLYLDQRGGTEIDR